MNCYVFKFRQLPFLASESWTVIFSLYSCDILLVIACNIIIYLHNSISGYFISEISWLQVFNLIGSIKLIVFTIYSCKHFSYNFQKEESIINKNYQLIASETNCYTGLNSIMIFLSYGHMLFLSYNKILFLKNHLYIHTMDDVITNKSYLKQY